MGMKSSPYNSVRYFYWAEEFSRGDPLEEGNALRCDRVILNLPGMPDFDLAKSNVVKWNDTTGCLAGDIITLVDDLCASGYDRENAWQVARQITSRLQYLGIQDAVRPFNLEALGQERSFKLPRTQSARPSLRKNGTNGEISSENSLRALQ